MDEPKYPPCCNQCGGNALKCRCGHGVGNEAMKYSELPPKCPACSGICMPLDNLWVCHTCRKNVASRLPESLQDPLKVLERGKELLRTWPARPRCTCKQHRTDGRQATEPTCLMHMDELRRSLGNEIDADKGVNIAAAYDCSSLQTEVSK